ncbi:hypothetical protein P3L10_001822 [Capsicum annuum]
MVVVRSNGRGADRNVSVLMENNLKEMKESVAIIDKDSKSTVTGGVGDVKIKPSPLGPSLLGMGIPVGKLSLYTALGGIRPSAMMEDLIAPIKLESQMNTSDNLFTKMVTGLKRPAPVTGGCRIEGFVRVKKADKLLMGVAVPGNLVISAHSAGYSFDPSQMNMSHVISNFLFGKTITLKVMRDIKLLLPYLVPV